MVEVGEVSRSNVPGVTTQNGGQKAHNDIGRQGRVSVVIPVYNGEGFIAEAINSALGQTYDNTEVIVVDDGSTDRTSAVLAGYRDQVRIVTTENGGLSVARNIGVLAATGQYVAFLDADDLWHPQKLALQVRGLEENPGWAMICNRREKFSRVDEIRIEEFDSIALNLSPDTYDILHRNPVHASSVLIRKQTLAHTGLFVPRLGGAAEDTEMWARVSKVGIIAVCEPHLTFMRDHEGNTTKTYQYRKSRLATLRFMRSRWSDDARARKILTRNLSGSAVAIAYEASERGHYSLARKYFYQAFRLNPGRVKWLLKTLLYIGRPDTERG